MELSRFMTKKMLIAAANHDNLEIAVKSNASFIILMNGKLNKLLTHEFNELKKKKPIFLHMDLIKGLSNDKEAVDFVKRHIDPVGIVSTKSNIIRTAKKKGLMTIQRFFLIDSSSLQNCIDSINENNPDIVEVMPAWVYPIAEQLKSKVNKPLILGGLIKKKEDIDKMATKNIDGLSCSKSQLWNIKI